VTNLPADGFDYDQHRELAGQLWNDSDSPIYISAYEYERATIFHPPSNFWRFMVLFPHRMLGIREENEPPCSNIRLKKDFLNLQKRTLTIVIPLD
jgi:hypothetical protein